jgi:hypothetical protein
VQFSPVDPDWILYNHEWPSDCGIRRLWLWDGKNHRRLRTEENGRSRADWSCHEMWTADGRFIIYHGKFADGTAYVGRVSPSGGDNIEIALPKHYHRYGHFTAGNLHNDWLVSDGYWHPDGQPDNALWGGEWITLQKIDWALRHIEWVPLCAHHSSWDCQDSHPHPITTTPTNTFTSRPIWAAAGLSPASPFHPDFLPPCASSSPTTTASTAFSFTSSYTHYATPDTNSSS